MDPAFWRQRWREQQIGFHQPEVNRLLQRHWPTLNCAAEARVFVPLCGKSLDMLWLAGQGQRVFGVELVEDAIAAFFAEHGMSPERSADARFVRYRAGPFELWAGDVFDLDRTELADCAFCYDRAALIALPAALRERYATELYARLPATAQALVVTLEYPQAQRAGPPFSVDAAEMRRLFGSGWALEERERVDILAREPGFRAEGVDRLHTAAWRLCRG